MKAYLGLDVGAVSTNLAVVDAERNLVWRSYLRTEGDPINSVRRILAEAASQAGAMTVAGCGTTGSGRHLAAALVGADVVKNEITSHTTAALHCFPQARTVIEIGGQDSKIIVIEDGIPVDFAMNAVCAAGTGGFLDHQAARMGITIGELAAIASSATESVQISGRCGVFAETDILEKQQRGAPRAAILRGLCESLVRNFLSGVARGKTIVPPVVFQGGVAGNQAVVKAFERELGTDVEVPEHYDVMGAIGVALLAMTEGPAADAAEGGSRFKGFRVTGDNLSSEVFECTGCSNRCDVVEISAGGALVSRWGSRCGRWDLRA
jgi:predicted CoA-substrate-specific enzyme activase